MSATAATLAGLSFLVLGESHMLYELRDRLYEDLKAGGASYVHVVGACGASAIDWLKPRTVDCGATRKDGAEAMVTGPGTKTQLIGDLIKADKPDVVLVVIGDTMGSYDNPAFPKAWAWQGVSSLTKAIASTKTACVWVGPAYGKAGGQYNKLDDRVERANRFFASSVSPCTYIDSLKFAKPGQWRTFDGQHFAPDGYAAWSKAIVNELGALPAVQQLRVVKK
ncbi:SGNH/GDSL hydrolase family protein [Neopusillimonas aromaticivorans]|uniref:SGNH/GDSL hydrolase family protein n=1 Tax=Neopusillimonas aromaticivorans TaxID=2979868 RepID=UPI00259366FE|nr:SGNH/GDSL hydrolase family protein [Neopusillimonas aromaticivorans]WJJ94320.1 SGNH/GDSL hydrolase family protein [Neopusillimonas aromaticivorans]